MKINVLSDIDVRSKALISAVESVYLGGHIAYKYLYYNAREHQVVPLSIAAGIVSALVDHCKRNDLSRSDYTAVNTVSEWLKSHKEQDRAMFRYIPSNSVVLMRKVRAAREIGIPLNEVIKLPRGGNRNRASQSDVKWWSILSDQMLTSSRRYTYEQIYQTVKEVAMRLSIPAPSDSTTRSILRKMKKPKESPAIVEKLGHNGVLGVSRISNVPYESVLHSLTTKSTTDNRIRMIAQDYHDSLEILIGQLIKKYEK
jgi:hypothetical protein